LLLAQEEVEQDRSVILDATFSQKNRRREALRLAEDMDADIIFVECRSPEAVVIERLRERSKSPSVSDARLMHLAEFRFRYEPPDEIPPVIKITIDTAGQLEDNLKKILLRVDLAVPAMSRPE
jgi:predicted kinase